MKIKSSEFEASAVKAEQYPLEFMPEIAFAGKSNVGKSSLINTLLNRKNIARVSQTPGKTQTINFYQINNCFRFVDLPGYGYAQVSKTKKDSWAKSIDEYLLHREMLLSIYLLQDSRREPRELDFQMVKFIESLGYDVKIIVTKADKLSKNKQQQSIANYAKEFKIPKEHIFLTSSLSKDGRMELLEDIQKELTQRGGMYDCNGD